MPSTPGRRPSCYSSPFQQGYPLFHGETVRLILQVVPDESFEYPKSDLCLKTMSMLSRSMSVVLRSSTRTFEAQCKILFINYPNTVVCVTSWNSSPFTSVVQYFLSCHGYHAPLVLGKDIPLKYVCIHIFLPIVLIKPGNHLSFPLVYLNPFMIYMI